MSLAGKDVSAYSCSLGNRLGNASVKQSLLAHDDVGNRFSLSETTSGSNHLKMSTTFVKYTFDFAFYTVLLHLTVY